MTLGEFNLYDRQVICLCLISERGDGGSLANRTYISDHRFHVWESQSQDFDVDLDHPSRSPLGLQLSKMREKKAATNRTVTT